MTPVAAHVPFSLGIEGLSKAFGKRVICRGAEIRIATGGSLAVVGPNGSGKSTLVRMIAGLLRPDGGTITHSIGSEVVKRELWHRHIGLVSPELALYEELSGFENLDFGNRVGGWGKTTEEYIAVLEEVGLDGRGGDLVSTYSSGMKQRLKYAAAFLKNPALLLLDEPTANLDEDGVARVWASLARRQLALIIATNEPQEAERAQSRFVAQAGRVWAVFAKDTRSEYRTRYAVNALFLFALVTLTALSFATGGAGLSPLLAAVFFWVIVFFSALSSLAQTFVKEVETKTATFLRLTAPDDAVFFGKWGFNLLLLLVLEIVLTPLFVVMLNIPVANWGVWIVTLILGAVGLVSTTTLIGALIAVAGVRGALFSVLSFPVLLPLMVVLIRVTEVAFGGGLTAGLRDGFLVLGAYAVVATTAGWLLFPFVWRD